MSKTSTSGLSSLQREILGIILIAGAVLLALSLFSYNPDDPSFNNQLSEPQKGTNLAGFIGAHLADIFFQTFGLVAFLWPLIFVLVALQLFLFPEIHFQAVKMASLVGLFISASALLSLAVGEIILLGAPLDSGGALGRLLVGVAERYLNLSGALILLVLVLMISMMVLTNLSWVEVGKGVSRLYSAAVEKGRIFWKRRQVKKKEGTRDPKKEKEAPPPLIIKKEGAEQKEGLADEHPPAAAEKQEHFVFLESRGSYVLPPLSLLESPEQV